MPQGPADFEEWRDRRNSIAMDLCSALRRSKGHVCSCYNGDEEPDRAHFDHCRKMVETTDKALSKIGVPIPPKE